MLNIHVALDKPLTLQNFRVFLIQKNRLSTLPCYSDSHLMHVVILKDYGNPIYWENAVKFLRTSAILPFFPLENILIGFDLVAQAPAFSHGTNLKYKHLNDLWVRYSYLTGAEARMPG